MVQLLIVRELTFVLSFNSVKNVTILFVLFMIKFHSVNSQQMTGQQDRNYFIETLIKISDPVLKNLSAGELNKVLQIETQPGYQDYKNHFTSLEISGRVLVGIAPWLELGVDSSDEGLIRKKYIELSLKTLEVLVDPNSNDFGNFNNVGSEALVHTAFLAHALLRSPTQLWGKSSDETKKKLIHYFQLSRTSIPYQNNWLLFSAIIESALLKFDGDADLVRLEYAVRKHFDWYLGDGVYSDGPDFHMDYYNSFVINPMLVDIFKTVLSSEDKLSRYLGFDIDFYKRNHEAVRLRSKRYAEILERLIAPDGTFPPIGRSLTYRFGVFQTLSQTVLYEDLSEDISYGQVRAALTQVIKRTVQADDTFDSDGWLTIGLYGKQPELGETYISTASLYLCTAIFLCLGLPSEHEFWTSPSEAWTSKKVWSGKNISIDKPLKNDK